MSITREKTNEKVVRKIEALEEYWATKQARFPLPVDSKFSFNWFCALEVESEGLEKASKGLSCLRVDGVHRQRLNVALKDAQSAYDAIQKLDPKTQDDVARLKRERDDLQKQLKRLAQDVLDLMIENETYRDRLGVKQAQFKDMSKAQSLAERND